VAWIESHQAISRHRKTLHMVMELKVDRHKLIGHLHELWWWGLDNASAEGLLGHVPHSVIAEAAGWPERQADRFVGVMVSAGFLEVSEDGYVLHDWYEYAGKFYDQKELRRAANRQSQAARRHRLSVTGESRADDSHDDSVHTGDDSHDDQNDSQHPTGPNQPDLTNQTGVNPQPPLRKGAVSRRRRNGVDPEQRMSFPTGVQP
jgi:hypothetical protein